MFWRWRCENPNCLKEFVKPAGYVISLKCKYCGSDEAGFLKVKEQPSKNDE